MLVYRVCAPRTTMSNVVYSFHQVIKKINHKNPECSGEQQPARLGRRQQQFQKTLAVENTPQHLHGGEGVGDLMCGFPFNSSSSSSNIISRRITLKHLVVTYNFIAHHHRADIRNVNLWLMQISATQTTTPQPFPFFKMKR